MKHVFKSFSILSMVIILTTTVSSASTKENNSKVTEYNHFYSKESCLNNGILVDNFFSREGAFIGSSKEFSYSQLNESVKETISKKYLNAGYQIKESIAFTNDEDETTYYFKLVSDNKIIILQVTNENYVSIFKV